MKYILQHNLFNEDDYGRFIQALDRFSLPYQVVKVIPFAHEIDGWTEQMYEDIKKQDLVAFGATTLVKIAIKQGWNPGVWFNDNFNCLSTFNYLDNFCLNNDLVVLPIKDIKPQKSPMFYRPLDDLKAFTGSVFDWPDFKEFKDNAEKRGELVNGNTLVAMSSVKKIVAEWRFFIVKGKPITCSQYKVGTQVITSFTPDSEEVWNFANKVCDKWLPEQNVVLDIGLTFDQEYKVVEFNCINASGFYKCDMQKVLLALEE